jgi:RNA polymerase sigma-70 factor (ECF subfamily)
MDTDQLLDLVEQGDPLAAATLLTRHKQRLHRMVQLRLDPRLSARLDPSDVVQDVLAEAHKRLATYAQERDIPFYPWLRSIAWDKLIAMKRRTSPRNGALCAAKPASSTCPATRS